jgi:hypothetical protein
MSDNSQKFFPIFLSFLLLLPPLIPVSAIKFAKESRVCGIDGQTYPSLDFAEKNKISLSYDFPCQEPPSEYSLYERKTKVTIVGSLLDFYSDTSRTLLLVKNNRDQNLLPVSFSGNAELSEILLPGDQISVSGLLNKNTGLIEAETIKDLSAFGLYDTECRLTRLANDSLECDTPDSSLIFSFSRNTRVITGLKNSSDTSDLASDDILRIRYSLQNKEAGIIILKKRGESVYLKNHLFISEANFISLEGASLIVDIPFSPPEIDWLDLSGQKSISNKDSVSVRKYYGLLDFHRYQGGDNLKIIAQVNDGGEIKALNIKNESIID